MIKKFEYRGDPLEEFSNSYWFKAPPPGDAASWEVLVADLLAAERKCYPGSTTYVRAYGYNDNADTANHVFMKDWNQPGPPPLGTLPTPPTGIAFSGDQAALMEWKTDGQSSKGKAIYLRKYLHDGYVTAGGGDSIMWAGYGDVLLAQAEIIAAIHGGLRSRMNDINVLVSMVSPWVTTRTLKHRGKRGGPLAQASLASGSAGQLQEPSPSPTAT